MNSLLQFRYRRVERERWFGIWYALQNTVAATGPVVHASWRSENVIARSPCGEVERFAGVLQLLLPRPGHFTPRRGASLDGGTVARVSSRPSLIDQRGSMPSSTVSP